MKEKKGQLRVWHIPQVPMEAFRVNVENPKEAKKILEILADYDIFQFEHNVKPDYSNAAGLEIFDEEWLEWEDEEGNNIDNTELY
jgi:hypothetical protein